MNQDTIRENGLPELHAIIEGLIKDLKHYTTRKTDINWHYVDKQNLLIENLVRVYNIISSLQHYDIWLGVENQMQELRNRDKYLSGHYIHLRILPFGNNFGLITHNPFE